LLPPWLHIPDEVVQGFEASTGAKVTLTSARWPDIAQKMAIGGAAGSYVADVIESEPSFYSGFWRAGWFLPLETRLSSNLLQDVAADRESFSSGGHLYGVPYLTDFRIVMYNKSMFQAAGLSDAPATLKDLATDAQMLKTSGKVANPIGLTMSATENTGLEWFALTLADGGEILDANYQPMFTDANSPGYLAFKFMVDSLQQGLVSPGATNQAVDEMLNQFLAGDSAWILTGPGQINLANDPTQSKIAGAASLSLVPGSTHTVFPLDEGLGIPYTAQNPDAAASFIEYVLQPDAMVAISDASGTLPATTSGLAAYNTAGKITLGDIVAQQSALKVPLFKSGIPAWYSTFSEKVSTMIQAAAVGTLTVDQAITQIADTARQLAAN
jgi:multiple sugar transport system substrate-binding protein